MSKTSTTNSTQNSTGTTNLVQTPTNPDFVNSGVSQLAGQVSGLASANPSSYVAPANSTLNLANANAQNLSGTPWDYAGAQSLASGVGNETSPSIASNIQSLLDPYTDDVVNSSLAGFDQNAAQTKAQNLLTQAQDTTFGGSGGAIQNALTDGQLSLARGQLESGIRSQGYDTALGGATSQAQLDQQTQAQRLAAAGQITNTADSSNNAQTQAANTQGSIGSILQQIQQAMAGAPINSLGSISSILDGLPLNLLHGTTSNGTTASNTTGNSTTSTSDPLGSLGSALAGLGAIGFAPFTGGASLAAMGADIPA